MNERLIIDCDPGVDDALAILLALAAPQIDLLGITVTAGNASLDKTLRNAQLVLALGGASEVPVFSGAERAIMNHPPRYSTVHSENGLGGFTADLPLADVADGHAVDYLIDTVMGNPADTITLAAIGPMTNVALAMLREPEFAGRLKRLMIMGGSVNAPGNITPTAEFNFYFDPVAADIVVSSGAKLEVFGLNLTAQAVVNDAWIKDIADIEPIGAAVAAMVGQYNDPALHDPCVIASIIDPTLFEGRDFKLSVDYGSGPTEGQCIVYQGRHLATRKTGDAHVWVSIRNDAFLQMLRAQFIALNDKVRQAT